MERENLMAGPPATLLLENEEAAAALRSGEAPEKVAARFPSYAAAWAALAERAYAQGDAVTAYAPAAARWESQTSRVRRSWPPTHRGCPLSTWDRST